MQSGKTLIEFLYENYLKRKFLRVINQHSALSSFGSFLRRIEQFTKETILKLHRLKVFGYKIKKAPVTLKGINGSRRSIQLGSEE